MVLGVVEFPSFIDTSRQSLDTSQKCLAVVVLLVSTPPCLSFLSRVSNDSLWERFLFCVFPIASFSGNSHTPPPTVSGALSPFHQIRHQPSDPWLSFRAQRMPTVPALPQLILRFLTVLLWLPVYSGWNSWLPCKLMVPYLGLGYFGLYPLFLVAVTTGVLWLVRLLVLFIVSWMEARRLWGKWDNKICTLIISTYANSNYEIHTFIFTYYYVVIIHVLSLTLTCWK